MGQFILTFLDVNGTHLI